MIRFLTALWATILLLGAVPSQPRIVTLVPSLAEDAFAIGANVVAVSRFTDDSPQAKGLPVVADFQSVDVEAILRLHPDVVIGLPSQDRLTQPLRRAGVVVVLVPDDSYDDIFRDLRVVGKISHREAAAARAIDALQQETHGLAASVRRNMTPTVFFALGTGPIWTVGRKSYLDTLIHLAGGRNAAAGLASPYGEYSEEALLRAQPDIIIAGHDANLQSALDKEPWRSLRAVREGHIAMPPDGRITNALYRPSVHYNEGLRWLIERLSSLSTSTTQNAHSNRN